MASFSSISKSHFHARSISLPSRSHQLSEFDDSGSTTSSSTSSSIGQKVDGLKNVFTSVDNFLQLPTTQRALSQECQNSSVNELLDELLRLLDLCTAAKDALLMTRDSAQELQSALRRKRGDCIGLTHTIQDYQSQRKIVKKAILKALRISKSSSVKKIQETAVVVTLREMESVTFRVLESVLRFIHGSNSKKWSLVSSLMGPKSIVCDESSEISQVEKVDVVLARKSTSLQVGNLQKELAQLELSLQDLQEGLEFIYRSLIKTRVHLLNVINC